MLPPNPAVMSPPDFVVEATPLLCDEDSCRRSCELVCVPTSSAVCSVAFICTAAPLLACGLIRSGDVT
jgi:hypothetical protein